VLFRQVALRFPRAATRAECDHRPVGDHQAAQAAQAVELVRALRRQQHQMTTQLAWVERQDVTGRNGPARALRMEAASLRRDIHEAQFLIDRLHRRYLKRRRAHPTASS
jgi:hypothetical protein